VYGRVGFEEPAAVSGEEIAAFLIRDKVTEPAQSSGNSRAAPVSVNAQSSSDGRAR
jgi:hypothetical protein